MISVMLVSIQGRSFTCFWSLKFLVIGLVRNLNIGIFSHKMINVKLCYFIKLYLFIPLSVSLTIFQGHNNVKQF